MVNKKNKCKKRGPQLVFSKQKQKGVFWPFFRAKCLVLTLLVLYDLGRATTLLNSSQITRFRAPISIRLLIRKVSLNNWILVNISLMQVGLLSEVSSFSKLIRMICLILSFHLGSDSLALSFSKSLRLASACLISIMVLKKSAFNLVSYNR